MKDIIQLTAELLKKHPMILAAGQSGADENIDGDIDIFVYCADIPSAAEREALMLPLGGAYTLFEGKPGHWGVADMTEVAGTEIWLMYFSAEQAEKEIKEILDGQFPEKLDNYFYPVGRLATIQSLRVLHDTGFLMRMKRLTADYPAALADKLVRHHAAALHDTEDLERAVSRREVLFFHFALDLALDHFLQALFALNRVYFPSRKRNLSLIEAFEIKPDKCTEALLNIVEQGSRPEGLMTSYEQLRMLTAWVNDRVRV